MKGIHEGQFSLFDFISAPEAVQQDAAQQPAQMARVHIQASGQAGSAFSFRVYGSVITEIDVANWTPTAAWLIDNMGLDYYLQRPHLICPDDVIDVFVHRFLGDDDDIRNSVKEGSHRVFMRECVEEWTSRNHS